MTAAERLHQSVSRVARGEVMEELDARWADVGLIAKAVRQHIKNRAYLHTGGSDGCALCADRTLEESLAAGHRECGVTKIRWEAAQSLAVSATDFDLNIAIARAIEDPRLFQWHSCAVDQERP